MAELSAIAKQGKPVYGTSDLPEFVQGAAFRNSVFSQLKFSTMPWVKLPCGYVQAEISQLNLR